MKITTEFKRWVASLAVATVIGGFLILIYLKPTWDANQVKMQEVDPANAQSFVDRQHFAKILDENQKTQMSKDPDEKELRSIREQVDFRRQQLTKEKIQRRLVNERKLELTTHELVLQAIETNKQLKRIAESLDKISRRPSK